jgi:hypothetical protein
VPGAPIQLQLHVFVTTRRTPGFVVLAAGRLMGPGCREAGEGAAVPNPGNLGDVYLFAGLTACATTIKSSEPRFSTERHVTACVGCDARTRWTGRCPVAGSSSSI